MAGYGKLTMRFVQNLWRWLHPCSSDPTLAVFPGLKPVSICWQKQLWYQSEHFHISLCFEIYYANIHGLGGYCVSVVLNALVLARPNCCVSLVWFCCPCKCIIFTWRKEILQVALNVKHVRSIPHLKWTCNCWCYWWITCFPVKHVRTFIEMY